MFSATTMFRFTVAAFRSVGVTVSTVLEFEYQQNLYYVFMKMLEEGQVSLTLNGITDSEIGNDIETAPDTNSINPGCFLPPALCFMDDHTKARLRATYARAKHLLPSTSRRISVVRLCGSDAASNVALYPSAMQVRLGQDYKPKPAPCSTPIRGPSVKTSDADVIVRGLAAGAWGFHIHQVWLRDHGSVTAKKSASTSAPRITHSYAQYVVPTPAQSAIRRKETFETSEYNKNRLRATLARTQSLYVPGSCIRPSDQVPGSQTRTWIHGLDGTMNVALYPKAMLVKLKTFEGDDMVDSVVCDPEKMVQGASERLNALVDGLGHDWLDETVKNRSHRIQRGGSTESVDSNTTASSEPHPTTPRDELCFSEVFGKD